MKQIDALKCYKPATMSDLRLADTHVMPSVPATCPVCTGSCALYDVIDLNRSCSDQTGSNFGLAGYPIYYSICGKCGFCFAPEFGNWSAEDFRTKIYNADYASIDPGCVETRPTANANTLLSMLPDRPLNFRHLDFGGGHGKLADCMRSASWDSTSHDPYMDSDVDVKNLGQFNLITAFEVFEHVPDPGSLMSTLLSLRTPDGLIIFSTLLSDDHVVSGERLTWWYAAPRNGHISLYSRRSLAMLAKRSGMRVGHFSDNLHVLFSAVPAWATHLFQSNPSASG